MMSKIEKILTMIKFQSFGKVTFKNDNIIEKELEKLNNDKIDLIEQDDEDDEKLNEIEMVISEKILEKQKESFDKEINNLKNLKRKKGKSAAIFKIKENIICNEKNSQGSVSMKHHKTKEQLFNNNEIKKSALEYCTELLTNREPGDEYSTDHYITKMLHTATMIEVLDDNEIVEFTFDLFYQTLEDLYKTKKEKYQFILQSGNSYKNAIFGLFKQVWGKIKKPQQWRNSLIIQLYKGKGPKDEFENMILKIAKPLLVAGTTKFQIGLIPNHRAQEHLFTLKSVIALYMSYGISLILQLIDISKFFDRENLRDALDSIYSSGIKGNIYRLIYEMNKNTQIQVKSLSGISNIACTGENVAQGSVSAGLISANNLDNGINKHLKTLS